MESRRMVSAIEAHTRLRVRRYKRINTGWENFVIKVNDRYIFRFPRFDTSWELQMKELRLTPWLARHLSIEIPNYEFVWKGDEANSQRFTGYAMIGGIPVTRRNFRKAWSQIMGRKLGAVLTELHTLRLPRKQSSVVVRFTPPQWALNSRKFYRRIQRYAYPSLSHRLRRSADSFWLNLLTTFESARFIPVFIHGDLMGGNVIFDPITGRLTGIIDWGDAKVADPAMDFVGLFEIDRELGEAALRNYKKETEGFRERIELYLKTIPFGELTWGAQLGSDYHKWLGLKHLEHSIRE